MANQLQVIDLSGNTALALPAHLANLPTLVGKLAQGDTRNRIGLKGREFHIFKGGVEEGVLETKHADVIIVGAYPAISRLYFDQPYEDGVALAPVCYSKHGKIPEDNSPIKQSDSCETCPQNVKGSSLGGGEKSKACGFMRRLAVLLVGDPEYTVFQLDLKSMSIWDDDKSGAGHNGKFSFTNYAKKLSAHNIDAGVVLTRLTFTSGSVPALQFQAVGYIDEEQTARVVEIVENDLTKAALELNMGNNASDVVPPPAQIAAPVVKPPAPAVAAQAPPPASRVAAPPVAARPAPVARPAAAPVARPTPVARPAAPRITAPATVALPPEDDTPEPITPIAYGQRRAPQAPLNTTRPVMRPAAPAPKATAAEVQQDVDALIAELDA